MPEDHDTLSRLLETLSRFKDCAAAIWKEYQLVGPGRVDRALFNDVDADFADLKNLLCERDLADLLRGRRIVDPHLWIKQLEAAVHMAYDLGKRCACTSQGLCFVTGEAGLIPRKDQHELFERSLQVLNAVGADLTWINERSRE